jgi:hypothetical protein
VRSVLPGPPPSFAFLRRQFRRAGKPPIPARFPSARRSRDCSPETVRPRTGTSLYGSVLASKPWACDSAVGLAIQRVAPSSCRWAFQSIGRFGSRRATRHHHKLRLPRFAACASRAATAPPRQTTTVSAVAFQWAGPLYVASPADAILLQAKVLRLRRHSQATTITG